MVEALNLELLSGYLLLGAVTGVVAGLLGVGGGLIIVPVLLWLFHVKGFDASISMQLAVGTSLATIIFTSLSSIRAHHRHGAVQWSTFVRMAPGILIGGWFGAWVAGELPGELLRRIFALFELAVAIQMGLAIKPAAHRQLPGPVAQGAAGGGIGLISAIVGVGGGTLSVPYLLWHNVDIRRAVATSAACGLPIALAGAAGFLYYGWGESALPDYSSGYIYWPAMVGIVTASVFTAPLGARLAHRLPTTLLKRTFALFLLLVAIRLLWV